MFIYIAPKEVWRNEYCTQALNNFYWCNWLNGDAMNEGRRVVEELKLVEAGVGAACHSHHTCKLVYFDCVDVLCTSNAPFFFLILFCISFFVPCFVLFLFYFFYFSVPFFNCCRLYFMKSSKIHIQNHSCEKIHASIFADLIQFIHSLL